MTPLEKFGLVYLKREDLNPTGSAKDRALEAQVNHLVGLGHTSAVISSTGNAAISASHFCSLHSLDLTVFVSPKTNTNKLKLINAKIITTNKPVSSAFKFAKSTHSYFLRQSTDPIAHSGYSQIGQELLKQLPTVTSIFIPVGSGSTLIGISQNLPQSVKIYAVQPASHPPISSIFDHHFIPENTTITDSLNAKLLPLKSKVVTVLTQHQGGGVVVQDKDVKNLHQLLLHHQINTSAEGALALAGYHKIIKTLPPNELPVILLTGTLR